LGVGVWYVDGGAGSEVVLTWMGEVVPPVTSAGERE
jgi:hypothetical protein